MPALGRWTGPRGRLKVGDVATIYSQVGPVSIRPPGRLFTRLNGALPRLAVFLLPLQNRYRRFDDKNLALRHFLSQMPESRLRQGPASCRQREKRKPAKPEISGYAGFCFETAGVSLPAPRSYALVESCTTRPHASRARPQRKKLGAHHLPPRLLRREGTAA